MKYKYLLITLFLGLCAQANAEWFLRGTQNAWGNTQMVLNSANTMQLNGVVFTTAGGIKFDRFGDWSESYGVGGKGGTNIAVAAGTWDIKFFTDTKKWSITASQISTTYHLRGTNNNWQEGTLMTRVGTTDVYESCINFVSGDANGGPRFKIDPNGGWGDGIPATDFPVSLGWVKITFNSTSKAISTQQNLAANCAVATSSSVAVSSMTISSSITSLSSIANSSLTPISSSSLAPVSSSSLNSSSVKSSLANSSVIVSSAANSSIVTSSVVNSSLVNSSKLNSSIASSAPSSIYHVRGTFNGWLEGTLMTRIGTTDSYEKCINFVGGDTNGGPRFKIDPNGGWGDGIPAADYVVTAGWVKITFNSLSKVISVQQKMATDCTITSSSTITSSTMASSAINSSAVGIAYHLRGTFNGWQEGTLMNRIGSTDNYEKCVNFAAATGGARFKIDPNGGWGDGIPSTDFMVTEGWVKISFNSTSKAIAVQQNLSTDCGTAVTAAGLKNFSFKTPEYYLRSSMDGWGKGILMPMSGTDSFASAIREVCIFVPDGNQHFRIDPNGDWGVDMLPATEDLAVTVSGYVLFKVNILSGSVFMSQGRTLDCAPPWGDIGTGGPLPTTPFPSADVVGKPFVPLHIRGTNNGWLEGTLMTQIGNTDDYEACINFTGGDANGGPRFRIDPNGGWGDSIPATDSIVPVGWTKIGFNNVTKKLTRMSYQDPGCGYFPYALEGTHHMTEDNPGFQNWLMDDFFEYVDGDTPVWKICRDFGTTGDHYVDFTGEHFGVTRFGITNPMLNSLQSETTNPPPGASYTSYSTLTTGWTLVSFVDPNHPTIIKNMAPNCAAR